MNKKYIFPQNNAKYIVHTFGGKKEEIIKKIRYRESFEVPRAQWQVLLSEGIVSSCRSARVSANISEQEIIKTTQNESKDRCEMCCDRGRREAFVVPASR